MLMCRKAAHVRSEFRKYLLSPSTSHSRQTLKPANRVGERAREDLDPFAFGNAGGKKSNWLRSWRDKKA